MISPFKVENKSVRVLPFLDAQLLLNGDPFLRSPFFLKFTLFKSDMKRRIIGGVCGMTMKPGYLVEISVSFVLHKSHTERPFIEESSLGLHGED